MNTAPGTIGVAMLGYAFIGKAHSRAFREASYLSPALVPRLVSISGRTAEKVEEARRLHGWEEAMTDWREQVADERIQLFDNGGPNDLHAEPTIEAARNGKHVLCEKPLGRTANEAHAIWRAAEEAAVVHMCGFNYRFVPAVRLAREIVESGDLGELFHFRARYLQSCAGYGESGERLGFDLYPYTEDQVAAVRRSVLQWNFIDSAAAKIDDAALRQAQQEKDAVRAYELVYAALGAE